MKEKTLLRLDKLEEVIRQGNEVAHIAIKDAAGIHWDGGVYANDESFNQAVGLIPDEVWGKTPLVIIRIHSPKVESVKMKGHPDEGIYKIGPYQPHRKVSPRSFQAN